MDFRILGPLAVYQGSQRLMIGGSRQQTTLAMLLLEPDNVIPLSRLIDAMWDEPPATARAQVQICISNLRRTITCSGGADLIDTRSPGYLLRLEDSQLDAREFDALVASGRRAMAADDPAAAAAQLRSALALWRGPALCDIASPVVQNSVAHLNERRLTVLEECLDAELRSGHLKDLIGELVKLTKEHPMRESLRAMLMSALYRSGRQAEALEVYRATRRTLTDELGIEPGEELQRLHQSILSGDPLPDRTVRPQLSGAQPTPPAAAVPRLLPAAIPDFTGRRRMVSTISSAVSAAVRGSAPRYAVPVHVIFGPGGAGTSTLAVHVAHRLADEFPDGQLFVRLRVGEQPANPADVLGRFLRALGMPGPLPDGLEERAEIYRNRLGQRRVLVMLDDAVSQQQILPLLPGSSTCAVLVTSRKRLTGLPAADRYEVGAFTRRTAVELLTRIVGTVRVSAEPEAVDTLCRLCGYLPLALRIVAARLAARPHWSVAALVDRLLAAPNRLDELSHGEMGVRASISMSYDDLSAQAQRLFRLLALAQAPNFAHWVGAPLLETDLVKSSDLLEELAEAYLIDAELGLPGEPPRYRFHDITRLFALERLLAEEVPEQRRGALERLVGALLFLAGQAHCREYAGNYLLPSSGASRWKLPDELTDRLLRDPLTWYEQERLSIVAAVQQAAGAGLVQHSWDLALSAVTLFEAHSDFSDWRSTHEIALRAACAAGDKRGEAAMRYSLGSLHLFEKQNGDAAIQFDKAGRLFSELSDEHGVALVLRNTAILDRRAGSLEQALARSRQALTLFQRVGDRVGEAHVLHNMAQVRLDYGQDGAAAELLDRAASICTETGNRRVYAQVQHLIGDLRMQRGDLEGAAQAYLGALAIVRGSRDRTGECYALVGLARVDLERGRIEPAKRTLTGALEIARGIGDGLAVGRVVLALADAELRTGQLDAALRFSDQTLCNCEHSGPALLIAQALVTRGKVHRAAGNPGQAMDDWERARGVLSKMELRGAVSLAAELSELQLEPADG